MSSNAFSDFGIVAGCLLVALASYHLACDAIPLWGETVKSAFDCYLGALAKQLGFSLPTETQRQLEFWHDLSRGVLYRHYDAMSSWERLPLASTPAAGDSSTTETSEPGDKE